LPEVVADFLATKPSLHTRQAYETTLRGFFEANGFHVLDDLHPAYTPMAEVSRLIRDYLDAVTRRDSGDEHRVVNPATVNARAAALSSFFEWLVHTYHYPENPVSGVFSSHKTSEHSTTESLSRGEVVDMLTDSEAKAREGEAEMRNYLLLACLFGLALRRSEVARLRWDDISKDGTSITIYRKGGQPQQLPLPPKLALSEKEDVHAIMNATGHSRVEMLRYYDTRDQMQHNAINRMARFL